MQHDIAQRDVRKVGLSGRSRSLRARVATALILLVVASPTPCAAQDLAPPEASASATAIPSATATPTTSASATASATPTATAIRTPERYLVSPLGGDAPDALSAEACDAVRATLLAEGFEVIDPADVAAAISPDRLTAAHRLDDLRPIATDVGANAIATVAVWTSDGAASSVIVSIAPGERSFSATESVTTSLSESARDALRAALARRRDALLVSGSTSEHEDDDDHERAHEPTPHANDGVIQNGQLFGIVGPGFLAALGAAGIGGGIYASLDETCDQRSPTGVCIRGERPNYALGVLFIAGGALALAGAIVWWVVGSSSEEVSSGPRIDVVMLPEGGGYVGTRGVF
jgi:hypothetical protein